MRIALHCIVCDFPIFQRETVEFALDDTLFEQHKAEDPENSERLKWKKIVVYFTGFFPVLDSETNGNFCSEIVLFSHLVHKLPVIVFGIFVSEIKKAHVFNW
jgi:hypothetical protein